MSKNPHQLPLNQHVLPKASIARMARIDGCVEVFVTNLNKKVRLRPRNPMFCAYRAWNYHTEVGLMRLIEEPFQRLAAALICGLQRQISASQHLEISRFFALWLTRCHIRENPITNKPLNCVLPPKPEDRFTEDERQRLEKAGLTTYVVRDGAVLVPGNQLAGPLVHLWVSDISQYLRLRPWRLVRVTEAQWLIPDICTLAIPVLPLTPELALVWDSKASVLDSEEVCAINYAQTLRTKRYYFGADLSKCLASQR